MSSSIHIVQVDVYSPDGSSAINNWVQDIIEGKIPEVDERIYYWVHIRDAERALKILTSHDIQGNFHLSGTFSLSLRDQLLRSTDELPEL